MGETRTCSKCEGPLTEPGQPFGFAVLYFCEKCKLIFYSERLTAEDEAFLRAGSILAAESKP